MLGAAAILGMPPFGVFASEFLILTTVIAPASVGRAGAPGLPGGLVRCDLRQGPGHGVWRADAARLPHRPALLPVFVHLALVLLLGLYIPPYLADWYRRAAQLIG